MKILFIFLLTVFTNIQLHAQKKIPKQILTFEHFKLKRAKDAKFDALLSYDIKYNYTYVIRSNKISLDFTVNAEIYPEKSYFQFSNPAQDSVLLNHEQGHADILVLNARTLLRTLQNTEFTPSNYKIKIESLNKDAWTLTMIEQDLYDAETSHGEDKVAQERWNKKFEAISQ